MSARALRRLCVVFASFLVVSVFVPLQSHGAAQGTTPSLRGGGGWSFNRTERCLLNKINRARQKRGKGALRADKQLGYVARKHAKGMARNRGIYHDGNLQREVTRWRSLGQNTGRGNGCRQVARAFMRSQYHRINILDNWRFVGVGTERRGGNLYVQQVFETRRDPGNVYHYP